MYFFFFNSLNFSQTGEERPGTPTIDEKTTDVPLIPDMSVPPPTAVEDTSLYNNIPSGDGQVQQIQTIDSLRSFPKRPVQPMYG